MSGPPSISRSRPWGLAARWAFGGLFVVAGIGHFASTDRFAQIMPPYLPYHRAMVLISGAFEIALGILLLIPRTKRLAAWGLVALLVAVFPANVHMYLHRDEFPVPPIALLARLPAQFLLILWALVYTRPTTLDSHVPPPSEVA